MVEIQAQYYYVLVLGQALCAIAIIFNLFPLMLLGATVVLITTFLVLKKLRHRHGPD